jgi:hypothetical protein
VSRLLVAQRALTVPGWAKDALWRRAQAIPSLDLRFADSKSLVDATTGQSLITFTRASSGTFVDSAGIIQTAANDAPRFDHNPTTGESLGLLVEEQRTNLVLQSEDFSTTWANATSTESVNQTTSPAGTVTADRLIEDSGSVNPYLTQSVNVVSGTTYTFSCYAKEDPTSAKRYLMLLLGSGQFGANIRITVNLATGTSQTQNSPLATSVTNVGDGWYRVSVTASATSTASTNPQIRIIDDPAGPLTTYTGDNTSGLYLWGAQLEAGAFPTSYIPTTTATVTRSADVASISGSNFSAWFNALGGTLFAEADRSTGISSTSTLFSTNDGGFNNRFLNLRHDTSSALTVLSVTAGATDATSVVTLLNSSNRNRIAVAQVLNDLATAANGSLGGVDSSVAIPVVTQASIGSVGGASFYNGTIRRLTYWPQRLPNSTLQSITL